MFDLLWGYLLVIEQYSLRVALLSTYDLAAGWNGSLKAEYCSKLHMYLH